MLEFLDADPAPVLLEGWRARVSRAARRLGWPAVAAVVRPHGDGSSFAIAAPLDQLFTATEVNEWSLCATLAEHDPAAGAALQSALEAAALAAGSVAAEEDPPRLAEAAALDRLERLAAAERRPPLRSLVDEAERRGLPWLLDEEQLTLGAGAGGRHYSLDAPLPRADAVPWAALGGVPTALVTGSNGKTTTVRLVAACLRAQGLRTGLSCTDGLFLDDDWLARGDYSGPVGARTVLRDPRVQAAVLETARGGILRRGLAVSRADAAVVTNVSGDHFGEYGIHDLAALAEVKLTVAAAVTRGGVLVLNADDAQLRAASAGLARRLGTAPRLAWFAADDDQPLLDAHREAGGATCAVRGGRLHLTLDGAGHDLGAVADLPITAGGRAGYNVANLAAAALAAAALGVAPATIASVCAAFGQRPGDNPGRLMRYERDGVQVIVDYAHNPEGLRGLLELAESLRAPGGRLGLLLGHAGNRENAEIERLAATAAAAQPALVVVKELPGFLRGREPGEVPRILRAALERAGLPAAALPVESNEVDAARRALAWAETGDVLVLPVHGLEAREQVLELLQPRSA